MYECPNCGGNLRYDIPSKMMACASCDSKFDPYEVSDKNGAQEQEEYEVTVFRCPQCGGEIYSTDNTAAGFCTFCGSSAVLESRLQKEHRPKYIIPFGQTKEQCKKAYMKMMGKAVFAPKELKSEKHINEFRGIYMPYWIYDVQQGDPDIQLSGTTEMRKGDYIITSHYNLDMNLEADYNGIAYDASSSFSDNISGCLAPFDTKAMKEFTPAYLSGFYADSADVDTSLYVQEAEEFALGETEKFIEQYPNLRKYSLEERGRTLERKLHSKVDQVNGAMFPVWFMAYKNNDRVAYATVNGQTGKVVADLPVDVPKYLGTSAILTIPIFLLLNRFFTVIPGILLGIVALIAAVLSFIYYEQIDDIAAKEGKEDDKGAIAVKRRKQRESHKKAPGGEELPPKSDAQLAATVEAEKKKDGVKAVVTTGNSSVVELEDNRLVIRIVDIVLMVFLVVGGLLTGGVLEQYFTRITVGLSAVAIIIFWFRAWFRMDDIEARKGRGMGLTWILLPTILSVAVALINPVSDIYYYSCAGILLITMLIALVDLIRCYNLFATRPLPQFHYKGGDDRA